MSILQEYAQIRKEIGEEKYQQIVKFLDNHPHYFLSDVYYQESVWQEMEKWIEIYCNKWSWNGEKVMYIVKCYVFADSKNANLVIPYKTKKSAESRYNQAIQSRCYNRVKIVTEDNFRFI